MRTATLQDVARLAGVSTATASRVLSGHPATSVAARTRVAEAATELGFRPNAQARSLRKARTESIGVVVSDRYIDLLLAHRADGIVIAPQGDGSGSLRDALKLGVPLVFVDRTVDGVDVPSITSDNFSGITQAVEHLVGLGHHRIGFIAGPQATSTGRGPPRRVP